MRSSERPSSAKTDCTARPTISAASGGKNSEVTPSATPPPMSASANRMGERPGPTVAAVGSTAARSSSAETAASVTSSAPPPRTTAVDIAMTTMRPICNGPTPIARTSTSATDSPTTTPPISSAARVPRWP